MRVEEVLSEIGKLLTEYSSRKHTGRINFSINFRQGGIGNITADLLHFSEIDLATKELHELV